MHFLFAALMQYVSHIIVTVYWGGLQQLQTSGGEACMTFSYQAPSAPF